MKNKKVLFGIFLVFLFIASSSITYAYFSSEVLGNDRAKLMLTNTGTLEITYNGGPQILSEDIYPGWTLTKTVTVRNTGSFKAYYSINWLSINNTIEQSELVMSAVCTSTGSNCKQMSEEPVGNAAGPFLSGIPLDVNELHTYVITFTFKEMSSTQDYNQGKIFSGTLNIGESVEMFTLNGTLLDSSNNPIPNSTLTLHSDPKTTTTDLQGKFTFEDVEAGNHTISGVDGSSQTILSDNISFKSGLTFNVTGTTITKENAKTNLNVIIKLGGSNNINTITEAPPNLIEKMNLAAAQSDTLINFANRSSATNGQGLYYTSDLTKTEGGETVYYYRGVVENNYVVFAGFCWRIVRTNEDGSIKLRYGGEPEVTTGNYICPQTGTNIGINNKESVTFTFGFIDNRYVGYMLGESGPHTNSYDNRIKTTIDTWYRNNILNQGINITSKIANTIYCNDRSTYSGTGTERSITSYGASGRLTNGNQYTRTNASPQYKCPNSERDGFTLSVENGGISGYGNNKLTYAVGLLTADEVSYAGGTYDQENTEYYLYTSEEYWTMSPFGYAYSFMNGENIPYIFVESSNGKLNNYNSFDTAYKAQAVPVISINSDVLISSGIGEYNSPYEIN